MDIFQLFRKWKFTSGVSLKGIWTLEGGMYIGKKGGVSRGSGLWNISYSMWEYKDVSIDSYNDFDNMNDGNRATRTMKC